MKILIAPMSAIAASKLENVKVVTSFSYPVQKSFALNPEYSNGFKAFIRENKNPIEPYGNPGYY